MILDSYFRRPVFWDYLFGISISVILTLLSIAKRIYIASPETLFGLISDLATIALTMAGFILTLMTVLISFKSSVKKNVEEYREEENPFDAFFWSKLYFETIKHLKNAIKSLAFIALAGYILKLIVNTGTYEYIFTFDVLGVVVVFFTVSRALIILTKIVEFQRE
jgi:hypothetical protein